MEIELHIEWSSLIFVVSITYNLLCILDIPIIDIIDVCKIWRESEVNLTQQLLDKVSLVMEMRLTWKEGIYKTLCMVRVGKSMIKPDIWVKIIVPLGKETQICSIVWYEINRVRVKVIWSVAPMSKIHRWGFIHHEKMTWMSRQ